LTPLDVGCLGRQSCLITMLLKARREIDAADRDGLTPLAIATQNAKIKAARAILEAGADVNAPVPRAATRR